MDVFWLIPPIQDAIATHLSRHELSQCALVSHALSQFAIPFLWHSVEIQNSAFDPRLQQTISKRHLLVRDLNLVYIWPRFNTFQDGTLLCPNLESFTAHKIHAHESGPKDVVSLLESHPGLCKLQIGRWSAFSISATLELLDTIQGHPSLENVDLDFIDSMGGDLLIRTLKTFHESRRLIKASLNLFDVDNDPPSDLTTRLDDLFQVDCSLQELGLQVPRGWSLDLIQELLKHCPHLRHLSWKRWLVTEFNAADVAAILGSHCPRLESLELHTTNQSRHLELIVKAVRGLKRLAWGLPFPSYTGVLVVLEHQTTLEHLDLSLRGSISFPALCAIACRCSKLKSLKAIVSMEKQMLQPLAMYRDKPWACKDLRVLDLRLGQMYQGSHPAGLVYDRIASMSQLEQLGLHCQLRDADFVKAFRTELPKLRSLMNLIQFTTTGWPPQGITSNDVDQMLDLWPNLLNLSIWWLPQFLVPGSEYRWQLRLRRPRLKIGGRQL